MRLPDSPPSFFDLVRGRDVAQVLRLASSDIGKLPRNRYLHWSQLKHRTPPQGLLADVTVEDWWLATKLARGSASHVLPLVDARGKPFVFTDSGYLYRMLHEVDRGAGGLVALPQDVENSDSRDLHLKSSLLEEAITSSQLEGASTTRLVAKDLLRTGRRPLDASERMILNNHRAMGFVRELADTDLSMTALLDLQRILTEGTLTDATCAGRLRRPDEDVAVVDERDGTLIHRPPDAAHLPERLARLFAFANDDPAAGSRHPARSTNRPSPAPDSSFLHPGLKAILLHFMIGYEHPFVDGNGRTARALFYWAMARAGYWLAEYLSISTIIRKAPAQYVRAYLFSERDDNDVTYFLDYNLRVILQATAALHRYLVRKANEQRNMERLLDRSAHGRALNHRQVAALRSLGKRPNRRYTIAEHQRTNHVTYQTARTDLLKLAELGLLRMQRTRQQGRAFHFTLAADVETVLDGLRR